MMEDESRRLTPWCHVKGIDVAHMRQPEYFATQAVLPAHDGDIAQVLEQLGDAGAVDPCRNTDDGEGVTWDFSARSDNPRALIPARVASASCRWRRKMWSSPFRTEGSERLTQGDHHRGG